MSTSSKNCSLSIELLPEFGWSIKNQPVYGPGSVFQGFVKLNFDTELPIERVRLAFYAIETIPPFDISPGVIRSVRKPLFSVQSVLWDSKQTLKLSQKSSHVFPFTIQMPMVQFPPSIDHSTYSCCFRLIALLDTPTLDCTTIKEEVPILCMPFVETSLLKTPTFWNAKKGDLSAELRMAAQEFVPGDNISITLRVNNKNGSSKKKSTNSLHYVTVHIKLIQTLTVSAFDDVPNQSKTVAAVSSKLLLINSLDGCGTYCDGDLSLKLPYDLCPSYDYSKLANISYRLQLTVEQKGPMGGIWNYSVSVDNISITVGTLGYGIRTSNELKLYSDIEESTSSIMSPQFMKAIEYEDSLPLYDASKLPDYESTSIQSTATF
ncbi:hypothetical protein INT48_004462 [Thamnidium elegans]|uniref:Arrestin C-terminal-like domain-containing protein n=1 Tax=Thamnidium elegans TaxID=101142 RepID=A0A8H7VQ39_9FUNG|nr:hypothetical protein INT48_004462 [Thamnidium elegans]